MDGGVAFLVGDGFEAALFFVVDALQDHHFAASRIVFQLRLVKTNNSRRIVNRLHVLVQDAEIGTLTVIFIRFYHGLRSVIARMFEDLLALGLALRGRLV